MKKNEIQVGGHYVAKVSNRLVTVRVDAIREYDPSFQGLYSYRKANTQTRYDVTNLATGRKTTFRSAAKFRAPTRLNTADVGYLPIAAGTKVTPDVMPLG